jgi:signal transduction histidine kinase
MVREHHPPNRALVNTRIRRAPCAIASSAVPASTERRGSRPIRHETCSISKPGEILMHLGTNSRARKVKQILLSLLTNVLKFPPRSSVTVSCTHQRSIRETAIDVADAGIGIAEVDQVRIFEGRVSGRTSSDAGGRMHRPRAVDLSPARDRSRGADPAREQAS